MAPLNVQEKPTDNAYPEWLLEKSEIDISGGFEESWHEFVTLGLKEQFEQSQFWKALARIVMKETTDKKIRSK